MKVSYQSKIRCHFCKKEIDGMGYFFAQDRPSSCSDFRFIDKCCEQCRMERWFCTNENGHVSLTDPEDHHQL